jgi:hypothetical protein
MKIPNIPGFLEKATRKEIGSPPGSEASAIALSS